jgi:hypothetical protein
MPKGRGRVIGYLLFVIGGREEEASGQESAVIRKDEEVAFLRGRDALVPL